MSTENENLNGCHMRTIWSSDASKAQRTFQRRVLQERIAAQEIFDNTAGYRTLGDRIRVIFDLASGTNKFTSSTVFSGDGGLFATPEEAERRRRENMGI